MLERRKHAHTHGFRSSAHAPRRLSAGLACGLAALLCACTLSSAAPEAFLPEEDPKDAGYEPSVDSAMAPPASGNSDGEAAAGSGSAGEHAGEAGEPAAGSAAPSTYRDAGTAGSTGIDTLFPDASTPRPSGDAQQAWDDTACAFELAGCLLLDPLNYAECLRMNMQRCDLLTADAGAVRVPSPACAMQTANCIAQTPDKAQECLAVQETCTL